MIPTAKTRRLLAPHPFPRPLNTPRFIEQYYKKVSDDPAELHKFYVEDSSFSHTENPQDLAATVSGLENIQNMVRSLDLPVGPGKCSVDLTSGSVDVQSAGADDSQILISVTGRLVLSPSSYPFCQTFLLVGFRSLHPSRHLPSPFLTPPRLGPNSLQPDRCAPRHSRPST